MMYHEMAAKGNYRHSSAPHHDRIRDIINCGLRPVYDKVLINVDEITALAKEKQLIEQYGRVRCGTGPLLNKSAGGYNSGVTEKPVTQYDLDGAFIAHHQSVKKAALATNANASYITACCKGKRKSSGGFQWTYKDATAPTNYTKQYFKPVLQFDLNQALIAEFPSLTHAQNATGVELHNISECCRGRSKTAGGFIWRYKEKAP